MYSTTGLLFPYYQSFFQEAHQLEEIYKSQKANALLTTISEYDLGGEGDLFKAPEPIVEEPVGDLDPMRAVISMISGGEDAITSQGLEIADIDSLRSEQLWSEAFYDCKDILAKEELEAPLSEVMDIKIPIAVTEENQNIENKSLFDVTFQKSVSSGCLSSMEWIHGAQVKPNFLGFPGMDFGAVNGMRRAFSEGDIKTLGNGNMSHVHSLLQQSSLISNCSTEERREKLSRYRNKKTKRNFGRKIKYACRKALADNQPRIRGRFAKNEESDVFKKH